MATPSYDRPLRWQDLLAGQDGVLSRVPARAAGLSEDQWQWRMEHDWQRVLPGVAVTHRGPVTTRQLCWAAVLYAGDGAYLSADAALVVHGMERLRLRDVHVVSHRGLKSQRLVGGERPLPVHFHRTTRLADLRHPARVPPVLRLAPAALHAVAWAPDPQAAEWRLAAVVQQRLLLPSDLRAALQQMPRLPRRALVAAVLDDVELGAHAASELDFLRFLRRHRLRAPDRLQRPVRRGSVRYLDAWWERPRVSVEVDGAHHRLVGTWDSDALRGNDVVIGERHDRVLLLRYTRGNFRHQEQRVAAQLRAALT